MLKNNDFVLVGKGHWTREFTTVLLTLIKLRYFKSQELVLVLSITVELKDFI